MPVHAHRYLAWLNVLLVTIVASALFTVVGLPSPVLLGSLVGAIIGSLVRMPTLERIASHWVSVSLVTLAILAVSLVAGRLLARRTLSSPRRRWRRGSRCSWSSARPPGRCSPDAARHRGVGQWGARHDRGPDGFEQLGYALIGVRLGLRFTRTNMRTIARLLFAPLLGRFFRRSRPC